VVPLPRRVTVLLAGANVPLEKVTFPLIVMDSAADAVSDPPLAERFPVSARVWPLSAIAPVVIARLTIATLVERVAGWFPALGTVALSVTFGTK
jgi:hypothetical protein